MSASGDADPRGVGEADRVREALSAFRWPLRLHGFRVLDDTREAMATAYTRDRASALVILANSAYRATLALPNDRDRLAASEADRAALERRVAELEKALEKADRRTIPLMQALLAAAPHYQGAHGIIGEAIASALGVPHPIRVPDLIALVEKLGIEPPDVWPWEPRHALARALTPGASS